MQDSIHLGKISFWLLILFGAWFMVSAAAVGYDSKLKLEVSFANSLFLRVVDYLPIYFYTVFLLDRFFDDRVILEFVMISVRS